MWDLLSRQALWLSGGGPQPSRRSQRRLARQRGHKLLVRAEVISADNTSRACYWPSNNLHQDEAPIRGLVLPPARSADPGVKESHWCAWEEDKHILHPITSVVFWKGHPLLYNFLWAFTLMDLFFLNDLTNLENINPACQVSWFHQRDLQNVVQTSNTNNLICSSLTIWVCLCQKIKESQLIERNFKNHRVGGCPIAADVESAYLMTGWPQLFKAKEHRSNTSPARLSSKGATEQGASTFSGSLVASTGLHLRTNTGRFRGLVATFDAPENQLCRSVKETVCSSSGF